MLSTNPPFFGCIFLHDSIWLFESSLNQSCEFFVIIYNKCQYVLMNYVHDKYQSFYLRYSVKSVDEVCFFVLD